MSSNAGWKSEILDRLIERDNKSKATIGIYRSFGYLNSKVNSLENEVAVLQQDDTKLELSSAIREKIFLEKEIEARNQLLESEKVVTANQLSEIALLQKNMALLTDGYKNLHERFKRLQEETKMKNQNIEVVNDDLLSLQIENNLLNNRLTHLTAENDQLVKRWMDKVSKDAQVLNDANEVLEQSRKSLSPS